MGYRSADAGGGSTDRVPPKEPGRSSNDSPEYGEEERPKDARSLSSQKGAAIQGLHKPCMRLGGKETGWIG